MIQGNELADTLAKEATTDQDIPICYDKIPRSVYKSELERISVEKWLKIWNQTTKGSITKAFFPRVEERLNMKPYTNQALTTILTGHGNIKAYLYRFKIIDFLGPFRASRGLSPLFSNSPSAATNPHIFSDVSISFLTSFFTALGLLMIIEPPDNRGQSPFCGEADHIILTYMPLR